MARLRIFLRAKCQDMNYLCQSKLHVKKVKLGVSLFRGYSRTSSTMPPRTPLPYSHEFASTDEYVDSLLKFCSASTIFQTLCGGVHILDFFTTTPSLYHTVVPDEWRDWLMSRESMDLLDLLMRDDPSQAREDRPPQSLLKYIREIRKHSLRRTNSIPATKNKLPSHIAVGMIPKKVHEVTNFADYVTKVADECTNAGNEITHFVDFGSGQNYLGRTLASPPYNKHIVAVESKEANITGAKGMDVFAGVAEREKVMRNKKLYRQRQNAMTSAELLKDKALRRAAKPEKAPPADTVDLRPTKDLATIYTPADGKGYIHYVEHRFKDGDLSAVVEQIEKMKLNATAGKLNIISETERKSENPFSPSTISKILNPMEARLMAISIHSCGNLSHHGIRSLLLNPAVQAIAIVGCCYNLLTERLGPPTFKLPHLRANLRAINAPRVTREAAACDPHGFPMSDRVGTYDGDGLRLNITARMMAVQAPQNWSAKDSDAFFTRHFYRALLQRIFLDRGVVTKLKAEDGGLDSTDPVIVGSLRKSCYGSFVSYVRGAIEKLGVDGAKGTIVLEKMGGISDKEIEAYAIEYDGLKKQLSVTWSLMAFSAGVVESLIVVDRWLFLEEHPNVVKDAWVEAVFDYQQSPRNLVVVGIKK
jgi:hypothetical protein